MSDHRTACQAQCRYAKMLEPGQCCMDVDPVTRSRVVLAPRKVTWRDPEAPDAWTPTDTALRLARAI